MSFSVPFILISFTANLFLSHCSAFIGWNSNLTDNPLIDQGLAFKIQILFVLKRKKDTFPFESINYTNIFNFLSSDL